jgi:hypothetical protein
MAMLNSRVPTLRSNRDPASSDTEPHKLTVAKMLQFGPPDNIADRTVRKSKEPIDPHESEVFTLTGDLRRVVVEENDCDFHFELAPPGGLATATRVIVELPRGDQFLAEREQAIAELTANGYDISVGKPIVLDEPLRMTVTGSVENQ